MCWKDASASAARIFEEQKQDLNTYLSWQLPKGAEGQLKPRKHSIILALSGTNLSYFVHQLTRIISWQKNNRFTAKPKLQLLTHRLAVKANLQEKIWNTLAKSNNFHEREQILTLLEQPSVVLPFTNNEQREDEIPTVSCSYVHAKFWAKRNTSLKPAGFYKNKNHITPRCAPI